MPYGRCFVLFSYVTGMPQDFRGVSRSKVVVTGIFNRIYIQVSVLGKRNFFCMRRDRACEPCPVTSSKRDGFATLAGLASIGPTGFWCGTPVDRWFNSG